MLVGTSDLVTSNSVISCQSFEKHLMVPFLFLVLNYKIYQKTTVIYDMATIKCMFPDLLSFCLLIYIIDVLAAGLQSQRAFNHTLSANIQYSQKM